MKIKITFFFLALLSLRIHYSQGIIVTDTLENSKSKKIGREIRRGNRARYLHVGLGLASSKLQDFAVSPLYYKGPLILGSIIYNVQGDDLAWGVFTSCEFGFVSSKQSRTSTMIINPELILYYMKKSKKLTGAKIRTYLGPYLMTGGNFRFNSGFFNASSTFYDYLTSCGLTAKINSGFNLDERKFTWNQQGENKGRFLALNFQVYIPIVHSYLRPDYAVVSNFPSTETNYLPSMKTASWGEVARLSSQFDVTYYLSNNNAFRFTYKWDAYTIDPGFNKETVSSNTYQVSLLFRLNRKTLE
jgi:hypothetical protein